MDGIADHGIDGYDHGQRTVNLVDRPDRISYLETPLSPRTSCRSSRSSSCPIPPAPGRHKPVERVDDELRKLADDMLETMYDAPGIGLAAIQVGVPRRMRRHRLPAEEDERARAPVLINPGDPERVRRARGLRGRLPVDPGLLRRGRAPGRRAGALSRPRRQAAGDRGRGPARRPACSTRSTISMACCSSTICRKLKRDMVIKKFDKAAKTGDAELSRSLRG